MDVMDDHRGWAGDHMWLIGTATLAPLSAALSLCSLLAFHSYRHRWRTLDLFLVTLVVQELLVAGLHFGRAITLLTSSQDLFASSSGTGTSTCPLFVWASLTLRTFQVITLTSSVLDRAFALRWPYSYRLSVRRNQVRYHIVVLAIVSILVGIASTFARRDDWTIDDQDEDDDDEDDGSSMWPSSSSSSSSSSCFLMPMLLDKKFVVFVVFLHGLVTLIGVVGLVNVTAKLAVARFPAVMMTSNPSLRVDHVRLPSTATAFHQHQQRRPLPTGSVPDVFWPSPVLRASCSSLRRSVASSTSMQARLVRRGDFRWRTVASVTVTGNLVNHLPYLAMLIVGRWFNRTASEIRPSYLDGATSCLALLEGLLLPVVLWAVDPTYRTAVANSFIRMSRTGKSVPTSFFGSDRLETDTYPGLESLSCSTLPRRHGPYGGGGRHSPPSIMSTYSSNSANGYACSSTLDKKVLLTDSGPRRWTQRPPNRSSRPTAATASMTIEDLRVTVELPDYSASRTAATFNCDANSVVEKMKFMTKIDRETEEHIYATLTDRMSTTSEKDIATVATMTDEDEPDVDENNDDGDDDDDSSFTTSASDDFEFHLTRPVTGSAQGTLRNVLWEEDAAMASYSASRASTMSIRSKKLQELLPFEPDVTAPLSAVHGRKRSSLSMNDLDLLDLSEEDKETVAEEIANVLSGNAKGESGVYRFSHGGIEAAGHTLDRPLLLSKRSTPVSSNRHRRSTKSVIHEGSSSPKRQYLRNPLLMRARFTNRPRTPCFGIYGSNWKYRPTVLPRQDFPWRKSPTQPFQAPTPSQPPTSPSTANDRRSAKSSSTMANVDARHPPPYRKTFISDFL